MSAYSDPPVLRRPPGEENMNERRNLLRRLSEARGRSVLALACGEVRPTDGTVPGLEAEDLAQVADRLRSLVGSPLDLVLDLPGGPPEVLEELVRLVRSATPSLAVLVPRYLGPPGLLVGLAADQLLLDRTASVAPLLPLIATQGRAVPAHALLAGIERIRTGSLPSFDAMFRGLSPADPVLAEASTRLCHSLAERYLHDHLLAEVGRSDQAAQVADRLCDGLAQSSSARHLGIDQLQSLGVPADTLPGSLGDLLERWVTLARQTVQGSAHRFVETPQGTLVRRAPAQGAAGSVRPGMGSTAATAGPAARAAKAPAPLTATAQPPAQAQAKPRPGTRDPGPKTSDVAVIEVKCACGALSKIQANLAAGLGLQEGHWAFPPDDQFHCPECMAKTDLTGVRSQIEAQAGRKIVG